MLNHPPAWCCALLPFAELAPVCLDDADDGNFDDTLSKILGASSRVATFLDLDLAFGAVDVNDDLACTSLLSPLSPLPPPIASPLPSAAAGEPI